MPRGKVVEDDDLLLVGFHLGVKPRARSFISGDVSATSGFVARFWSGLRGEWSDFRTCGVIDFPFPISPELNVVEVGYGWFASRSFDRGFDGSLFRLRGLEMELLPVPARVEVLVVYSKLSSMAFVDSLLQTLHFRFLFTALSLVSPWVDGCVSLDVSHSSLFGLATNGKVVLGLSFPPRCLCLVFACIPGPLRLLELGGGSWAVVAGACSIWDAFQASVAFIHSSFGAQGIGMYSKTSPVTVLLVIDREGISFVEIIGN
ncbi:hypothetical protein Bca4012_036396 [Brassica carinata]